MTLALRPAALHPAAPLVWDTAPGGPVPARPAHPIRLGVLTPHNPRDRRTFSGTVFHAVAALAARGDLALRVLGPHRPQTKFDRLMRRGSPRFEPAMLDPWGRDFEGLDAVLGLVASPLLEAAATLTDLPLIHVTDATPGFLREIYGRDVPAGADARETRVLARATAVYYSRMMAERAGTEFGAAALKGRTDVTVTGFLDKNRPRDAARLAALYARAHLFVLPTRADCTPMVVAEALAHGTPVLATDVGGTPEMIGQGAGRTLPPAAGAADWARTIAAMTDGATAYAMMSDAASERTARQLNWDCWAGGIAAIAAERLLEGTGMAA